MTEPGFTSLPDLASRLLGGGVVAASDELFAEKENLVKPGRPVFAAPVRTAGSITCSM